MDVENCRGRSPAMVALRHCVRNRLALPSWLERVLAQGFERLDRCEVLTLDDCFGRWWKRGTHQHAERCKARHRKQVHAEAWRLLQADPSRPIARPLFDEIGGAREIAISGSAAEKRYYEAIAAGALDLAVLRARLTVTSGQSHVFSEIRGNALTLGSALKD